MVLSKKYTIPPCLLFLSLGLSKAGINISIVITTLLSIYLLTKNNNHISTPCGLIEKLSISLFFTGVVVSFLANFDLNEVASFLNKGAIFLLLPIISNPRINNVKINLPLFYLGMSISILYSLSLFFKIGINNWQGERIGSFWDIGRWGEILAYSIAFSFPFIFERITPISLKITAILFITLAIICVVLSGGRAPILAIVIVSSLFLLITRYKVLLTIIVSSCLLLFTVHQTEFGTIIKDRLQSITNTTSDVSNISRITMWQSGLNFLMTKTSNYDTEVVTGSGLIHFNDKYYNFMDKNYDLGQIKLKTMDNISFTDSHNSYLDMLNKLGVVYFSLYIALLISIMNVLLKEKSNQFSKAGACLIATHLIISFFYTSYLEYQTIALFSLLAICLSKTREYNNE